MGDEKSKQYAARKDFIIKSLVAGG